MNDKQEAKFQELTGQPVGHLVCKMAVPTIISMMVTACYNMVDTYFVGQLHSNSATGAVGVVFSLMAVIQAVGFFFGHGSGNYISRQLGRHETADAEKMAATGVTLAFLAGCVILVLGQIFLTPLARLLGSTDTILPYARSYLRIILLGAPYMTASFVLNNQLRFQGSAAYGMVGIAAGAVLNVGLDPLLIFGLNMGVAGAALATILSQLASFCMLLLGCARGGNLRIRLKNLCLRRDLFLEIGKGGLPSLCRQGLASIATICLNRSAGLYGDAAIAAMSVVSRAMMLAQSALIGFGQGFQPVCGFNYGAGLYHRVKEGFRFCVKWSTVFLTAVSVLGLVLAPQIIAVFRNDPEVIACQLRELLTGCDAVITSGGVSVGQKDYLPAVLERLGAQMLFAGVAQKPGSPMLAAEVAGKLVFCLSGNPFAAAATLEQYAVPALLRAAGRREESCILPRTTCTLTTGFSKPSKGDRYLRAKAAGGSVTIPGEGSAEAHSSGSLSAMIGCNCLVKLPAGSGPVAPGEEVEVLYFVY